MVVLDGSSDFYSSGLGDVWALSLSSSLAWTRLTPDGPSPGGRYGHSAIYDPLGARVVVFGGETGFVSYLDDVWSLSLTDPPVWTPLTPDFTAPRARTGHSAIYDPVRGRILVFGGSWPGMLADGWALSLDTASWTEIATAGTPPGGRYFHSAIYDPVRDRMVIFGGYGGIFLNDVWALSLSGTPQWTRLTPTGAAPTARFLHSAIYDPVRDRMLVFGGARDWAPSQVFFDDTWALSLSGTPAWTRLTPTGAAPSARCGHSAIYDPVRERMVVFAGRNASGSRNDLCAL
jgi:hypothetical protein